MQTYNLNPRKASDDFLHKLKSNLDKYSDLSPIIKDLNSGEFVTGNQRMSIIGKKYKKVLIEKFQENKYGIEAMYYIETDIGIYNYLEVRYTPEQFKESNITANSIKGEWDNQKLLEFFNHSMLEAYGFKTAALNFKHVEKKMFISISGIYKKEIDLPTYERIKFKTDDFDPNKVKEMLGI